MLFNHPGGLQINHHYRSTTITASYAFTASGGPPGDGGRRAVEVVMVVDRQLSCRGPVMGPVFQVKSTARRSPRPPRRDAVATSCRLHRSKVCGREAGAAGCTPSSGMILHYASSTPYTVSLSGSDELTVE